MSTLSNPMQRRCIFAPGTIHVYTLPFRNYVFSAGVPPVSTVITNTSSEAPVVTMRILGEDHQDAIVTKLGERLTLKIEIKPADGTSLKLQVPRMESKETWNFPGPYDIMAGHLVASSATGHWSYLLLNELGCPTDPTTFPALSKDPIDNRSLVATFTAFKFPESQLVRFNVIVKFCMDVCEPVSRRSFSLSISFEVIRIPPVPSAFLFFFSFQTNCSDGRVSYGRRRRSSIVASTSEPYVAEVTELFRNKTPDELPLQLSIIVQSPVIFADPLLSRENTTPDTILIAGGRKCTTTLDSFLSKNSIKRCQRTLARFFKFCRFDRRAALRRRRSSSRSAHILADHPNSADRVLPFGGWTIQKNGDTSRRGQGRHIGATSLRDTRWKF